MGTPTTLYYAFCGLVNGVSCLTLAIFVLAKGPRQALNRLYSCFVSLVAGYNFLYFFWAMAPSAEAALGWFVGIMYFVIPVGAAFMHFAAEMVGLTQSRRLSLIISYVLTAFFMVANHNLWLYSHLVPRYQFGWWPVITPLCTIFHVFWIWQVVVPHVWLIRGMRQAEGQKREQLKFVFFGTAVGYAGAATNWLLWYNVPIPPYLNILITPFQAIIAYSIVKHGLLDSKEAVKKSLVYSGLIAIITAAYLVMVLVMERSFAGFLGYRSFVATAVVAALIALGFNPLRDRIQGLVDRALFSGTPPELAAQREQLLGEIRKGEQLKAVATLAAGLAHEVKNPLASIKTFTEHLETHFDDPSFRAKFTKIVGGEVERINLIVQQLLEFAKPMPPKLQPVHLARVIDDTLEFLNNELVGRQVEVHRKYGPVHQVLADPQQLRQVFLNLFLNSLDAMNGHGQLAIEIRPEGDSARVSITDNGVGIAPNDLPHVFEPFFTTKAHGTGLGLPVIKGIIHEHGGRLHLTSQVGQGTIVEVRLPLAIAT